jgi:hypothetical protein
MRLSIYFAVWVLIGVKDRTYAVDQGQVALVDVRCILAAPRMPLSFELSIAKVLEESSGRSASMTLSAITCFPFRKKTPPASPSGSLNVLHLFTPQFPLFLTG